MRLWIRWRIWIVAASAAFALQPPAQAQVFPNGVEYDPTIPTFEETFNDPIGARITTSAQVVDYLRALQDAAPDQIQVRAYGRSWGGRELNYAVIGSAANMARLEDIQSGMQALADPRETSPAEAEALFADLPGIVWLANSVHGNELSPSDAALALAYHLLAARNDPTVDAILENALVVIDPVQNPDGRDRFVSQYYDSLGLAPRGSPLAAERDHPWPGGRVNHYLFDMNRDWFALTQPGTQARIDAFLDWYPLVFVDVHEMGTDTTYFFAPEAEPYNPEITDSQRESLVLIGQNNARWFDRFGFRYFTREVFDALYPGYGAAWPLFHGSIGTTYETASSRGLVGWRDDGGVLTYAQTVQHHFISTLATAETVAQNRERLLREFYAYRTSAIEEGRSGEARAYLIPPQADQATADRLARLLARQGVETGRADAAFRACNRDYPEGSYVIAADQPAGRLARTLLAEDRPIDPDFIVEQERRRAKGLEVEMYDVTAWSLPLMFNVTTETCNRPVNASTTPVNPDASPTGELVNPEASLAFLTPWGSSASARLLGEALNAGLPALSSDASFTHEGRTYPAGSLVFLKSQGPADMTDTLAGLARETGAEVIGVDGSWMSEGPTFGSEKMIAHRPLRIALAWDRPTSANSAGATRFIIERRLGHPVTPIRTHRLASQDLAAFDVLILPDGGDYDAALGERGGKALKSWVREGGVLIGLDRALHYLSAPDVGLSALKRETAAWEAEDKETGDDADDPRAPGTIITDEAALDDVRTPAQAEPDNVPGVLVRAVSDTDHWLTAGVKPELNALVRGSDIYAPLPRDKGDTAVRFAATDALLASGYLWEENQAQLAFKPFVTVENLGRGYVVGFTQDPTVRGYLDGLLVLFANAVFRTPARTPEVEPNARR